MATDPNYKWYYNFNAFPPEDDPNDYEWDERLKRWVVIRDYEDDDVDIDVCQHCGGYFAWTNDHAKVAKETGFEGGQRCIRCMQDECWVEER